MPEGPWLKAEEGIRRLRRQGRCSGLTTSARPRARVSCSSLLRRIAVNLAESNTNVSFWPWSWKLWNRGVGRAELLPEAPEEDLFLAFSSFRRPLRS